MGVTYQITDGKLAPVPLERARQHADMIETFMIALASLKDAEGNPSPMKLPFAALTALAEAANDQDAFLAKISEDKAMRASVWHRTIAARLARKAAA